MKGTLTARGHHSSACWLVFLQDPENKAVFSIFLHRRFKGAKTPESTIAKNELVANIIKKGDLD